MFNQLQQQQLQQHLQQQQQLLQLQQLLQQSPPQASLPVAISRGLPQQQPQQQLLNLQGAANSASLLNGCVLQRALLLQQLQGNLRSYNLATPNLTAPSLTPPQLGTPNLQQFFPQATQQSLLGPPPVRVPPIHPSKIMLSGRTPPKQARTPPSTTPDHKDSSSQTTPMDDKADPAEGSEEATEPHADTPDDCAEERRTSAPEPESCEAAEPPAKRSKSSEEPTEKGPSGQLQAKVQPQARMTAPKQTQTPELLPEPLEARVLPRFQPRVLQMQPQTQPQVPPADAQVQPKLQKQAQTQTSPEHLVPQRVPPQLQEAAEPRKQAQAQPQLQKQAQTQTYPQAQAGTQAQAQTPEEPPEQPPVQLPVPPSDQAQGQAQTQPQGPASERAPVLVHSPVLETPPSAVEAGAGLEGASREPAGTQVSTEESQEELTGGLDVGECEKRAREMLRVWGAGGSLKVTILQSSDSRAFSTVSVTPGPRSSDSTSATPAAAASTPSEQAPQFFCYICRASCCGQQEFQDHMAGAQHQQRLSEMQHTSQACLLSLLPVPRDVLDREDEDPPLRRWCNTCQVYYMGDLIQHRRTQDHKIAKQSLRPFCTVCSRYFKTPRKFVEHVKSQGHKDKAKELKMFEKEVTGQDEDHFITVDAVGCFEDDEDEEDDDNEEEEEEEIEVEEELCQQVRSKGVSTEEWKDSETYSPNTAYGVDFMVPVVGYVCRVCHKFCHSSSEAKTSHCKSLAHFENLQKYKKTKNPSPATRPVSRRCAITARNALTALFTSSGRSHPQPGLQDAAKGPSKVTAQPPQPPPFRRSARLKT
ncbi:cip1-interacting zinc finger protein isoform X3 [Phyllostomus discolor]|uniref:Cip1-interacting zinc finger protein isoform X3 n=1 Tax=Phyllostomus discolor TaxID=89673 RepID=A0A7E6DGT2_9CHIR|nr:cip1-interacting zinc finger protein isoform X3 [Phyllostomus discolor]